LCSKPIKIAQPNDILISVRAPVCPTNISNQKCCIGRGLSAIRYGNELKYNYLIYYFRANETKISHTGRGSTFSEITQSEIRNFKIPLPDLPTQIRIASELEKVDKAREKRRKALALTDQYLQSAFLDMFGDPLRNEKG